jgi:eukaryotic-like serine/threonine-protein kinase
MLSFITKRGIGFNLLIAGLLAAILILITLYSLRYFTGHNEETKVPSVIGLQTDDAKRILVNNGFTVEILDSIYSEDGIKNTVTKQSPEANALVKEGRTMYLTVNRMQPPIVEFPNMVGFSKRNAFMYLEKLGLKIGDTTFKVNFAKNSILEQWYQGKPLVSGTKLFMGSKIDLVIASGDSLEVQ